MIKKWYSTLRDELDNSYSDILLVSDPDNLSSIEYIQKDIPEDFIVHIYKNEMGLRQFRMKHKLSGKRQIIFISSKKDYFPSDIESDAEQLNWGLKSIFPGLEGKTVRSFPPEFYQKIYNKYTISDHSAGFADVNETLNLICSWLWGIKLQELTTKEDWILLLSKIYGDCETIPSSIKDWNNNVSSNLPELIWSGSDQFNEWVISQYDQYNISKNKDLEHDIDFGSSKLLILTETIRSSEYRTRHLTIKKDLESIRSILDTDHVDWFTIAKKWGELSYLKDSDSGCSIISEDEYLELDNDITEKFERFILDYHKDQFHKNDGKNLFTIDRVLQYIRYCDGKKKLLFCFDGMGFQEWYGIKDYLNEHGISNFKENAIYAMLPTVTSISRGALFNGKKDTNEHKSDKQGFEASVSRWDNHSTNDVCCFINADMKWHDFYLDYKCLGIIANIVDETAHDAVHINCNKRLMQEILNVKLKETGLAKMFHNFIDAGYRIFITSDHGTVWCNGNDITPSKEKYLVTSRSKRALLYPGDIHARDFYLKEQTELYLYTDKGVIGDKAVIFPKGRNMFAKKNNTAISHGGIHIEEVIIPFIEVLQ